MQWNLNEWFWQLYVRSRKMLGNTLSAHNGWTPCILFLKNQIQMFSKPNSISKVKMEMSNKTPNNTYVTVFLRFSLILNHHVMMIEDTTCHPCHSQCYEPLVHILWALTLHSWWVGHWNLAIFLCATTICKVGLWIHMTVCPCTFSYHNFNIKHPILAAGVSLQVDVDYDGSPTLKTKLLLWTIALPSLHPEYFKL